MLNSKITKDALLSVGRQFAEGIQQEGLRFIPAFSKRAIENCPKNAITGYSYSGVNFWNLSFIQAENKFDFPLYASKNAWAKVGAKIKPDQVKNGFPIFYWWQNKVKYKKPENEEQDSYSRWFLKITWAYNPDQLDLSNSTWKYPKVEDTPKNKVKDNMAVFNFVDNQKGLELKHSQQGRCYYAPELDYIHMTNKENFNDTKNGTSASFEYYSTLLHELVHWSGHKKRTGRFEKNLKFFKDNRRKEYALEELIAEIGANLLCIQFDMQKKVNKNSLAYLKSWISALKNDDVFIYKALSQSAGAIDFLKKNLKENQAKKSA